MRIVPPTASRCIAARVQRLQGEYIMTDFTRPTTKAEAAAIVRQWIDACPWRSEIPDISSVHKYFRFAAPCSQTGWKSSYRCRQIGTQGTGGRVTMALIDAPQPFCGPFHPMPCSPAKG